MKALVIIAGLAAAFWSAFQLQIISFAPRLSLFTIHNFEQKRWVLRGIALVCALLLVGLYENGTGTGATLVAITLLLGLSFLIDNTKAFRALDESDITKAVATSLDGDTMVVGVAPGSGPPVCYPIESLVIPRHLLNDSVGETPLLVSFCAACRSCIVYDPVVNGRRLHFQVVAVRRRNMVMRDLETGTLWQQATGEALYGTLKGAQLEMLMGQQMRLTDWQAEHPATLIAAEAEHAPPGRIPRRLLQRMLQITEHRMTPGLVDIGHDLPLRENVFGLTLDGVSKAYPVSRLAVHPEITDIVGQTPIRIRYNAASNHVTAINLNDGSPLVLESHWWFGWKEFHPLTQVWSGEDA